jgi:polyamine oxidase
MNQRYILVIGAGMAGLAAARHLIDNGFRVLVLEARDRLGGRIWTDESLGIPIDLGASWIHASVGNPVSELASQFAVETAPTSYESNVVFDQHGELATAKPNHILCRLQELAGELEQDASVSGALEQIMSEFGPLNAAEQRYFNKCLSEFQVINGADLHEQSVWSLTKFVDAISESERVFPRGYIQVAENLAASVPITYNEPAVEISYGDMGVRIHTRSAVHDADAAVVTLPLGVLQSDAVSFSPPLPSNKQQAIAAIKMGVMNKIALRFPKVFWPVDQDFIDFTQIEPGPFHSFFNWYKFSGEPVLITFAAGSPAAALEGKSDEEIATKVMQVLHILPDASEIQPTSVKVTRWASDEFARGSYSVVPVGADPALFAALGERVGRLFFAGEATALDYQGTVNGAYLSGIRAAKEVRYFFP